MGETNLHKASRVSWYATCTSPICTLFAPQNLAQELFLISLGTAVIPRINEKKNYAKFWEAKKCIMGDVQVAYRGNLPAPMKGRRIAWALGNFGKLTLPLLSRLARRERFFLQGRIKGLENFPGDRIAGFQCHAIQNRSK